MVPLFLPVVAPVSVVFGVVGLLRGLSGSLWVVPPRIPIPILAPTKCLILPFLMFRNDVTAPAPGNRTGPGL